MFRGALVDVSTQGSVLKASLNRWDFKANLKLSGLGFSVISYVRPLESLDAAIAHARS